MTTKYIAHYRRSSEEEQSIEVHLVETSNFAGTFAKKIKLTSLGKLVGLLHDFGKYSTEFQNYIRSAVGILNPDEDDFINPREARGNIDHSTAGAQFIWDYLQSKGPKCKLMAQVMSLCIASHHSGLIDCITPDGKEQFSIRMKKEENRSHLNEVKGKADKEILDFANALLQSSEMLDEFQKCLTNLFDGEMSNEIREFKLGLLARFLFSALIDADRLSSADFENTSAAQVRNNAVCAEWDSLVDKLENHLSGFKGTNTINQIRADISSKCLTSASSGKGLYQLTVPTGGGKTLASLRFAVHHARVHSMDRIIYVVPYTTIIDQNAAVARSIFEDAKGQLNDILRPVVLEHHSNLTPETDTWQNQILSENWDAAIIFTTMVQFLETLFGGGTRGARRMHRLANAVIVFDEIQCLPIKTTHLFNNAINFLVEQCGSTAVFCTATQPLLDQVDKSKGAACLSPEHQIMPDEKRIFEKLCRVDVFDRRKPGGWTVAEVAQRALKEIEETGSVLVVVNTKRAAREVYEICRQKMERVFHLSTNMCPAHRRDVIKTIKSCLDPKNPIPVICVSTQLIEAGVDIDFGSVIRCLAGLDSIAQAAGRCNRNALRPDKGRVFVINPAEENLGCLPDLRIAKEVSERLLGEYKNNPNDFDRDLLGPKAMEQYYKYYFFARADEMTYRVSANDLGHDDTLLSLLSTNHLSVAAYRRTNRDAPPSINLRQSFKRAAELFRIIDAPTEGVIVPYGEKGSQVILELCAAFQVERQYKLLRQAQQYSVNLFPNDISKLVERRCIHEVQPGSGIMHLDQQYYRNDLGVSFEHANGLQFLNV